MSTSSYDFLVEEEAQVVPSSLDHLSRHELCHMIYRLDYERHTLKEKLVALRLAVSASNVGVGRGGGRRRTKQQTTTSTQPPLEKRSRHGKKKACSDDDNEEEKVAKMQKTNNDESLQQEPTTLEEINAINKRLTQTIISEIKVTTHGGLLRPRTTAEENDISLTTAMHIMQHWGDKLTHDTKRMIKWEFKSSSSSSCEDDDIAKFLQCEKYLSGVRHNGKGFLVGSSGNNGNSFTQFAKFESMIVSYDKLTMMMKVQVSTRGCNEKGIA